MDHRILAPGDEAYKRAVDALGQGRLIGLPTETVYGLAANAWDAVAVHRIFVAKGRPATNPLIVHAANVARLREVFSPNWSPAMQGQWESLRDLWPGPLTVVAPRGSHVPAEVAAGRSTIAARIPDHEVALELLRRCPFPLAAPSANVSNYVSPTTAKHVADGLGDHVALILDGGPCRCGVESTIVALDDSGPRLLRPGAIAAEELADCLHVTLDSLLRTSATEARPEHEFHLAAALEAPGTSPVHYSPRTPLRLAGNWPAKPWPARIGRLVFGECPSEPASQFAAVEVLSPRSDLKEAAQALFAALRRLDAQNLHLILADDCPDTGIGRAIMDRLRRAEGRW